MSLTTNNNSTTVVSKTPMGAIKKYKPLAIPPFQREYKWEMKNCQQLLDDLVFVSVKNLQDALKKKPGLLAELKEAELKIDFESATDSLICQKHELGCIVIYPEEKKHYVVDGQQRLTTIFIMARCFYDLLLEVMKEHTGVEFENSLVKDTARQLSSLLKRLKCTDKEFIANPNDELNLTTFACDELSSTIFENLLRTGEYSSDKNNHSKVQYIKIHKNVLEKAKPSTKPVKAKNKNKHSYDELYSKLFWSPIHTVAEVFKDKDLKDNFADLSDVVKKSDKLGAQKTSTPFITLVALNLLEGLEFVVTCNPDGESSLIMFDRLNTAGKNVTRFDIIKSNLCGRLGMETDSAHEFVEWWETQHELAKSISKHYTVVEKKSKGNRKNKYTSQLETFMQVFVDEFCESNDSAKRYKNFKKLEFLIDYPLDNKDISKLLHQVNIGYAIYQVLLQESGAYDSNKSPSIGTKGFLGNPSVDELADTIRELISPQKVKILNLLFAVISLVQDNSNMAVFRYFFKAVDIFRNTKNPSSSKKRAFAEATVKYLDSLLIACLLSFEQKKGIRGFYASHVELREALKAAKSLKDFEKIADTFFNIVEKVEFKDSDKKLINLKKISRGRKYGMQFPLLMLEVMASNNSNTAIYEHERKNNGVWFKEYKIDPEGTEVLQNYILGPSSTGKPKKDFPVMLDEHKKAGYALANLYTGECDWGNILVSLAQEYIKNVKDKYKQADALPKEINSQ